MGRTLFEEDLQAYRTISEYAAAATTVEKDALHWAANEAKREGQSVRQAASVLRVSHSLVYRHQREQPKKVKNRHGEKVSYYLCRQLPTYQGDEATRSRLMGQYASRKQGFAGRAEAFEQVRVVAAAARAWEETLLRMCIFDGIDEQDMSLRQVARGLGVPHATVARRHHTASLALPLWATPATYLSVEHITWSHAPHRKEGRVPYEWTDHPDGSRRVRFLPTGVAILRHGSGG